MNTATTETITTTIDSTGVATVTLNNPAKHNAFDDAIISRLSEIFSSIDNNDAIRVMVLAANGKSFSAGADLAWMKRMAAYNREQNLADANAFASMLKTLNTLRKPTIARVQGAAFGGAVGLVSCCDIAIASEHASFSLSEVKVGLIPATISPYVIAAIGQRAARRYFITGERFDAGEAHRLGLVSQVVGSEAELDAVLTQHIDQLLANSPQAVTAAKQLAFDMNAPISDALIADSCQRIADIRSSEQGQEGLNAFLEKRPPSWQH